MRRSLKKWERGARDIYEAKAQHGLRTESTGLGGPAKLVTVLPSAFIVGLILDKSVSLVLANCIELGCGSLEEPVLNICKACSLIPSTTDIGYANKNIYTSSLCKRRSSVTSSPWCCLRVT